MWNHDILDLRRIFALQVRKLWQNSLFAGPNKKAWIILLIPRIWVMKSQIWLSFRTFCCWQLKIRHNLGKKKSNASGSSHWLFSENGMLNRLLRYRSWDIEVKIITKCRVKKKWLKFCNYSKTGNLLMLAHKRIIGTIF